jgi:hypothetical protein
MRNGKSTELSQLSLSEPTANPPQLALPVEIFLKIAMFSPTAVMVTLAGNRECRDLIQPELDKRAAKQLMEYVLNPTPENIVKARAIYAANPRTMFMETQGYEMASGIKEYFDETTQQNASRIVRRKIICSPLQAVYGTVDSKIYKEMATYFGMVEDGVAIAQKQLEEKFPHGFDYPPSDYDFSPLVNAITNDLINTDNPSDATKRLIAKFKKNFLPKDVTQGHHFNLNHLDKALRVYNQWFESWNWRQQSLFSCQVIGYLERLVTLVDAQAFSQSLYELLDEKKPQARALSFFSYASYSKISYDSLMSSPTGLGLDLCINMYKRAVRTRRIGPGPGDGLVIASGCMPWSTRVEKLCKAKTSELENIRQDLEEQARRARRGDCIPTKMNGSSG